MLLLRLFIFIGVVSSHLNKNKYSENILRALATQNNNTVHEECSYFSEDCFVIKDYVYYLNGEIIVRRHLKPKMNMLGSITIARLHTPLAVSTENIRVRHWKIDKRIIESSFPTGELYIAIGYITEALSYETTEKQQVLMIGLGGGVISNFLSTIHNIETTVVELDPVIVKIAERYFDHRDAKGVTKTLTENGVTFLEKAVQQGLKYRVIMVDADYNGDTTGTGLIGPVKEFIQRQTVQNMFQSLEDGGIVAVNVVSVHSREQREHETLKVYKEFFPSCYYIPFLTVRNKLLLCSKKKNWTWEEQAILFKKNLKTAINKLGFKELEYEISM